MRELVHERFHLGGIVHVRADRDLTVIELRDAVRTVDHAIVRHRHERESGLLDLLDQTLAKAGRRFACEELR